MTFGRNPNTRIHAYRRRQREGEMIREYRRAMRWLSWASFYFLAVAALMANRFL